MDANGIKRILTYINETKAKGHIGLFARVKRKFYSTALTRYALRNGSFFPVVSADIAEDICLPHGLVGIFVSQGAHIGRGCTIFHQVTIGSNNLPDTKCPGSPWIGDNVYVGAGAKIVGGVRVGNNVRIGANAVVTFDVPDNATVVLGRPRIILHEEARSNLFVPYDKQQAQTEVGACE